MACHCSYCETGYGSFCTTEKIITLRTRVKELEAECQKAGIGDYRGNYFLGRLTTTGKLRAERDRYRHIMLSIRIALESK